jgi:molybdopterin/thiamine biosynthesis adenylyltransferase
MNMKTITIVGVGALGSHVTLLLRNMDANLRIIDFDRVEQKNVQSQFHNKLNVGKSKVQSLSGTMQLLFGLKLGTIPHKLTTENDDQLLAGADLIIDCLDNAQARIVVQNFARRSKTACLHGALAADGGFGRVVWDERFVIDSEVGANAATCEDGAHLPFIAITSAYLARAAQEFLATGRKIGFEVNPAGANRT